MTLTRRKEADLQTLKSEVSGHENRLNMTKRSREIAVSRIVVIVNYNYFFSFCSVAVYGVWLPVTVTTIVHSRCVPRV